MTTTDTKQNNQKLSNCCKAPLDIWSSDESTSFYICTKCKKACDPYQEPTKQRWEAFIDELIIQDRNNMSVDIELRELKYMIKDFINQVRQQAIKETIESTEKIMLHDVTHFHKVELGKWIATSDWQQLKNSLEKE